MTSDFIDIHTHRFTGRHTELRAAGIHPWRAAEPDAAARVTAELLAGAQAVGETGLDFACRVDRDAQLRLFRRHLELAQRLRLPAVLHCVRAFEPVMDTLAGYSLPAVIFHGFIGSPQQAARATGRGYYLSFGIPAMRSPKTVAALRATPAGRIFAETDDSGAAIEEVYAMIAETRGTDMETLKETIRDNYNRIFGHDDEQLR